MFSPWWWSVGLNRQVFVEGRAIRGLQRLVTGRLESRGHHRGQCDGWYCGKTWSWCRVKRQSQRPHFNHLALKFLAALIGVNGAGLVFTHLMQALSPGLYGFDFVTCVRVDLHPCNAAMSGILIGHQVTEAGCFLLQSCTEWFVVSLGHVVAFASMCQRPKRYYDYDDTQ